MRIYLCIISFFIFIIGCAATAPTPQKTQLQIREFQTRTYQTNDTKMVMKAMLNVLQDEGYIVREANVDLGLLTATKEVDVESKAAAFWATFFAGHNARWKKNSIIECSCNIGEFGKHVRVRVNFQTKTLDNKGGVVSVTQVEDSVFYQNFFSKVDKGIFLGKAKL